MVVMSPCAFVVVARKREKVCGVARQDSIRASEGPALAEEESCGKRKSRDWESKVPETGRVVVVVLSAGWKMWDWDVRMRRQMMMG